MRTGRPRRWDNELAQVVTVLTATPIPLSAPQIAALIHGYYPPPYPLQRAVSNKLARLQRQGTVRQAKQGWWTLAEQAGREGAGA